MSADHRPDPDAYPEAQLRRSLYGLDPRYGDPLLRALLAEDLRASETRPNDDDDDDREA